MCVFALPEVVTWPNMKFTGRMGCAVRKARMRCLISPEKDIGERGEGMAYFYNNSSKIDGICVNRRLITLASCYV